MRRDPKGALDKRIVRATLKPPKRNDSDSDVSDLHEQIKKAESDRTIFSRKLKDKDDEVKVKVKLSYLFVACSASERDYISLEISPATELFKGKG